MVSIHASFRQSKEEATERVLRAFDHPRVKIFGHPTGRMLNKREVWIMTGRESSRSVEEKGLRLR